MSRDNDDHPIGWRSIYTDDRNTGEEGERERSGGEAKRTAEEAGGERPFGEGGSRNEAGTRREPEAELPENAGNSSLGRRRSAGAASSADPQARPDVGFPREFPSGQEENKRRKRSKEPDPAETPEETEEPAQQTRYRRKKGHPVLWSFCIALGLVLVTVGSALFYVWNGLRPPSSSDTPVRVTIASGMRASRVADQLEQSGLIRNAFLFSIWMKYKNEGSRFQAGEYEMKPGMTREEIVAKLDAGDTVAAATIKFTIPEGFTAGQIADRLVKEAGIDRDKFLKAMSSPSVLNASMWTKQIPLNASMKYPLEGYLFPETYEMKKGSTEEELINRMVAELDRKLGQLPEDWQQTMEDRGLTLHQLLTIASLVEREVVLDDERSKVASVIENRMKKKMPLQIDATIQYALGKQKEKLTTDDLKVDSPYNTYLHAGLPPGPIASPSLKSIEAALYPEDTDYLYYVTKKDGSNQHLFATTYKQHQKNIQQSEKNEKNASTKK